MVSLYGHVERVTCCANAALHFCIKHSVKPFAFREIFRSLRGGRSSRFVERELRKSCNMLIYKRKCGIERQFSRAENGFSTQTYSSFTISVLREEFPSKGTPVMQRSCIRLSLATFIKIRNLRAEYILKSDSTGAIVPAV